MAAYKDIVGQKITVVTSNPPEPKTGQMWYNSTDGKLRALGILEAWSSTSNMINQVTQGEAGTDGPRDAFAIWGGRTIPAVTTNLTEEYNGSGWSAGGNLGTAARKREGGGTLSAAWCANGEDSSPTSYISNVEEYNGTSWSEETNTPAPSSLIGGSGPQTAGIATLGQLASGPYPKATLEYDGSSWTSGGTMSVSRTSSSAGQVGPQTAAIITGGEPMPIANTESYDGTSWSEVGDLVTALGQCSDGTFGDQTAAVQCGGKTSPSPGAGVTTSQTWNGTSWSSGAAMGQARKSHSTSGTSTQGLACSGQTGTTPSALTSAEEYNRSTNAITSAAWASGGNMPQRTNLAAASGSQTANIVYGGDVGPSWSTVSNQSVLYDGTSWTAGTNIPGAESNMGGTGTQTAGIYFGGYPNVTTTVEWDGSSFSGGGAMGTGREKPGHNIGIQTAAVAFGGYIRGPDSKTDATEEYNGSSWTAGGALNTARYYATGAGIETAGLAMNGTIEPPQTNAVEEYNGSSWTSVNSSPYSAGGGSSSGTQTAALLYGGNPSSPVTTTAGYDGTNWSTRPSMANAASGATGGHAATSELAIRSGGYNNTSGQTEEFTGETETANIADFATS